MNLYVVRHGETDWNTRGLMQGIMDVDLNKSGIKSANKLSEQLSSINFDLIYSSPLKRAFETAKYISSNSDNILIDTSLIERSFGDFEGTNKLKDFKKYWDYSLNLSTNNVEPIHDLISRVYEFLLFIYKKYGNQDINILIVTHNGTNIAIDSIINGFADNFLDLKLKNCEYKLFKNVIIKEPFNEQYKI